MNDNFHILETTLRDGSYTINFSFTADDTAAVAIALEAAGVTHIEIGHGVGMNASNKGFGVAAATDEEYLAAAEGALTRATYGMFCIPGIARLEDIDLGARHGMGFIRIGTNVTEVSKSEEFIRKAKTHGMFVAANYMKSYAVAPEEFAKQALLSERYGADMVYIVDSAGGMFPEDIRRYYDAIRKVSGIPVGFHAHNNLGFAVANSIAAADMGITFVDASLQGLGRSAGNACTEMLVAALEKRGWHTGIDLFQLFGIGQNYIQPLLGQAGHMPLDTAAGYADFHSSYMPSIQKVAAKYQVDPAMLIIEWCKVDKVNMNEEQLEEIAARLEKKKDIHLGAYGFNKYAGREQDDRRD